MIFVTVTYSFIWFPQIVRSARRGRSSGLKKEYIIGTTICRLYSAMCQPFFVCCTLATTHIRYNRFPSLSEKRTRSRASRCEFSIQTTCFTESQYLTGWSYLLALFVCLQALTLILQELLGPTFFLPQKVAPLLIQHTTMTLRFCTSMPPCSCTTIILQCHYQIQKRQNSLLATALSAWTPSSSIVRCGVDPSQWKVSIPKNLEHRNEKL